MSDDIAEIRRAIRNIPNFPKPGILFKDITPLLANGRLFAKTIDLLAARYASQHVDAVLGIESRGFIIGAALAYRLGAGFSVVRKPGKLPYQTHKASYQLEYGTDSLEIHVDALPSGGRVVIADDLIVREAVKQVSEAELLEVTPYVSDNISLQQGVSHLLSYFLEAILKIHN